MSGHSKWSTIKRQKSVNDAKRGKIFTRHAHNIALAAREGGGDPNGNPRLAAAIEMARADSLPKENILRAIKKGTGELNEKMAEEKIYEAYGPAGVAFLVTTLTDNPNRTTANIRHFFTKHGGKLAESGSVAFQFQKIGFLEIELKGDREAAELAAIEAGALDLENTEGEILGIKTKAAELNLVQQKIQAAGYPVKAANLIFEPQNTIEVTTEAETKKITNLMTELENDEDVLEIAHNLRLA